QDRGRRVPQRHRPPALMAVRQPRLREPSKGPPAGGRESPGGHRSLPHPGPRSGGSGPGLCPNLEEADFECCADLREALLTIVVAGAGFAGVETIGGLNDFVRASLRFYPHLKEKMLRFVLVSAGPAVLPELSPKLGAYAERKLAGQQIEIVLNARVESISD